jgi:cell division protein ZapA
MPVINLKINEVTYQIACGEGEEQRLYLLAQNLEERIKKINRKNKVNDNKIFLLIALTMEDELHELNQKIKETHSGVSKSDLKKERDDATANALEAVAEYVETLVKKLENSSA